MRFADVDAVTVDAFGTVITLGDPVPALVAALAERGCSRTGAEVTAAFAVEVAYYSPRSLEGHDDASLADLRERCAGVFLGALGAELDPAGFAPAFVAAIEFAPLPGAGEALTALTRRGLALAVVSNWDHALPAHLERLGLRRFFAAVVTSAAARAAKPDAQIFGVAAELLGVPATRTVHVGDGPADELGAQAAGMRFVHAPLATAFAGWS